MIDCILYRVRIGSFNNVWSLKVNSFKECQMSTQVQIWLLLMMACNVSNSIGVTSRLSLKSHNFDSIPGPVCSHSFSTDDHRLKASLPMFCGNFYARYTYGNKINKGIRVFHLNIRKLQNKVTEVKSIVKELNPHLFGISECELRCSADFNIDKLKVPGYNLHMPRSWEEHGYARLVLYSKKGFECPRISELEDDHLQSIWVKFGFKNSRPGYYCHTYREHNSNLGNSLEVQKRKLELLVEQCERALLHGNNRDENELYILGDLNLDSCNQRWLNPDYRLYSLSQIIHQFCDQNNVHQIVNDVTRSQFNSVTRCTEISCIDHIYTNCKYKCSAPIVKPFGDSDHDVIGFIRLSKEPPEPSQTVRKRSYLYFDKDQFLEDLNEVDWTVVYQYRDLDPAVEVFTSLFRNILDLHAPWVMFQSRKNFRPWITEATRNMMKERDIAKQKAVQLSKVNTAVGIASNEEEEAWNNFRKLRNKINNQKKNDELRYKRTLFENQDSSKNMWATVKSLMNWKQSGTPRQIVQDNKLFSKPKDVAEIMNKFFLSKIEKLRQKFNKTNVNLELCKQKMIGKSCKLSLKHVSEDKILKILTKLKPSKSCGVDGLDTYSLKIAAKVVAPVLHHIVVLSIMQCKFPTSWRVAKVLPLHKKDSTLEPKNYRPVSILSPLSKVLERVVYNQVYDYFSNNQLFHPSMMGFRKNRSTLTALLQMYDRWVNSAESGKISGVLLLDLSAAFDLVSSDILLKKLKVYGAQDCMLEWIGSYMTGRQQCVWIDNVFSGLLDVDIGLPQGSILGPLMFNIFASDLPNCVSCDIDSFADDSSLTSSSYNLEGINTDLTSNATNVSKWMMENQLCLNADKTHVLVTGTSQRLGRMDVSQNINVMLNGQRLEESREKCENILGVQVESDLKWYKHVQFLRCKLKSRLAGLAKIRKVASVDSKLRVADGIFTSTLTYCLPLWGGMDQGSMRDLQKLQNCAARHVLDVPSRTNRNWMFDKLKWLTVKQLIFYYTVVVVFKIRKNGEPEYFATRFLNDNVRGNPIIKPCKLTLLRNSFSFRGLISWSMVPNEIRNVASLDTFKLEVRRWILENVDRFED